MFSESSQMAAETGRMLHGSRTAGTLDDRQPWSGGRGLGNSERSRIPALPPPGALVNAIASRFDQY